MLCALSLSLLSAGVAGAAVTTFVDLSALPGGGAAYPYGAADGINNSGQVTGCMSIGGLYTRLSLHQRDSVRPQFAVRKHRHDRDPRYGD